MFKQILILLAFLGMVVWTFLKTSQLVLCFYIFLPLLFLLVLYFFDSSQKHFFYISLSVFLVLFMICLVRFWRMESLWLGLGALGLFYVFYRYRRIWQLEWQTAREHQKIEQESFDILKRRYDARLESLHHLEKQVTGLLDLFEIARDFGDCLSMDSMADLLVRRVYPQLPFREMKLVKVIVRKEQPVDYSGYVVSESGYSKLSSDQTAALETIRASLEERKSFIAEQNQWIFPMTRDDDLVSFAIVEGADQEDLAKFEVLVAFLGLQVRKIKLYETVRELSIRDELTGVFVRRHFLERFEEEIKRSIKYQLPFAVLMLDIDHFKRYNDDHGHLAGDAVLRQTTAMLRDQLRKVDIVGRYGGEEFVVVLPETEKNGALEVAERIRSNIARHTIKALNEKTTVTVSIGIAVYPHTRTDANHPINYKDLTSRLIEYADQAMYRAKEEGRNRVVLHPDL